MTRNIIDKEGKEIQCIHNSCSWRRNKKLNKYIFKIPGMEEALHLYIEKKHHDLRKTIIQNDKFQDNI